jgi:hypothetical protein
MEVVVTDSATGPFRLSDAEMRMKVRCRECGRHFGSVYSTPFGDLWWGLLGSREAKAARKRRPNDVGRYAAPVWMTPSTPFYAGDCRCGRNAALGEVVHAALIAGRVEVAVPARLDGL